MNDSALVLLVAGFEHKQADGLGKAVLRCC